MTWDILIVFGLLALALALFGWERVSFDVTGLIVLCPAYLPFGISTKKEGEWLGRMVLGYEKGEVKIFGASVF